MELFGNIDPWRNRSSRSVKESRAIRYAKLQGNLLFSLRELRLIDIRDDKVKYNKPILLPFAVVIYITNSKVPALGCRIICGLNALSERRDHCTNFDLIYGSKTRLQRCLRTQVSFFYAPVRDRVLPEAIPQRRRAIVSMGHSILIVIFPTHFPPASILLLQHRKPQRHQFDPMKLVQLAIFTGLLQLCSVAHAAAPPGRVLPDILTAVSSGGTPLPSIVSQLPKAAPSGLL